MGYETNKIAIFVIKIVVKDLLWKRKYNRQIPMYY